MKELEGDQETAAVFLPMPDESVHSASQGKHHVGLHQKGHSTHSPFGVQLVTASHIYTYPKDERPSVSPTTPIPLEKKKENKNEKQAISLCKRHVEHAWASCTTRDLPVL